MAATPRPAAFSTLVLTDVGADALHVGAAVGSPACSGGIKAGTGTFMSLRTTAADGLEISPGVPTVVTQKLYNNSGNLYWNGAPLASGGSISGTVNNVPRFTGANTLGNSVISDDGAGLVTINSGAKVNLGLTVQADLRVVGGVMAGPGANVIINGATGKIPGLTGAQFDSLNGAAITNVTAVALVAGTHAPQYTFSNPANVYAGNGVYLTQLNASELIYGTLPDGRFAGTYNQAVTLNGVQNITVAGTVATAGLTVSGNGSVGGTLTLNALNVNGATVHAGGTTFNGAVVATAGAGNNHFKGIHYFVTAHTAGGGTASFAANCPVGSQPNAGWFPVVKPDGGTAWLPYWA